MLNQGETPSKRSKIEKETNFNVIVNFIILMVSFEFSFAGFHRADSVPTSLQGLCIACAIADGVWAGKSNTSAVFYEPGAQPSSSAILDALVTFG